LESILANAKPPLFPAERLRGPALRALAEMRKRGAEGVVAKRTASTYQGARSRDWRKVKLVASQELAILGFTPSSEQKNAIGALLVGVYERGAFRYAGKVGTGFSRTLKAELWRSLAPDRVDGPSASDAPRVRGAGWVRPRLVAEVAFTEWTRDGRLRHPSFRGLRIDKAPEECVRESL
jgi:bifunctional non-homologous end joining protein LigD